MSRIAKVGVVALGTGALVLSGAGLAAADAGAKGAAIGSPGFLSGNVVQVPVHVPINVCGNTVQLVGLLNPAVGNTCKNEGHKKDDHKKSSAKSSKKSGHRH
ncbi:chaplin [Streptomyces coeruleorubidus]|uniref:Chaplin n=1 Tax=Streptomyces coeruleorubidus TaxID=116188 RepID=A0ABZ0KG81_STRC4|nr:MULTISPECIES: chaplin [Streptomyces]WOT36801.1 chaplin [Streptomyces coeruleorubidus]GGU06328.1 membrane protein [Streptomyces bellus]